MTCRSRNITFEAPLRVTARLSNKATGASKSQEIYLGDVPVMTNRGTFVVNGIERVVVSQLIRSAGVFLPPKMCVAAVIMAPKLFPTAEPGWK